MSLPGVFRAQARACDALGSPFTARLLHSIADMLHRDDAVFARIRDWPYDPTAAGDAVPLRIAGGLHALVLSGQDAALAGVYPPSTDIPDDRFAAVILAAIQRHPAHLMHWLDSAPQTNEAGRSAALIAAGHLLSQKFGLPLRLLELGASAGLNLHWDQMALKIGAEGFGAANAGLTLEPDWTGDLPVKSPFRVTQRAGVDLNPLDPDDANDRLRMLSYIWPDQGARLDRMKKALDLARQLPAPVAKGDAAGWIEDRLAAPAPGQTTVIFHTIAWQYFPQSSQEKARRAIETAGAAATPQAPVVWLSMEADGRADGAALRLRQWPGDLHQSLGRADFHGRWVNWQPDG